MYMHIVYMHKNLLSDVPSNEIYCVIVVSSDEVIPVCIIIFFLIL